MRFSKLVVAFLLLLLAPAQAQLALSGAGGKGGGLAPITGDIVGLFTTMPNGPPTTAVGGQPFIRDLIGDANTVPATVVSGALVTTTASGNPSGSAAYTGLRLAEEIKSVYADVSFGDANDVIGLIAAPEVSLAALSSSSVHIVIGPGSWAVQWVSSLSITTVQSGTFTTIPFNTIVRVGWAISGTDITLLLPDGSSFGPISTSATTTRTNNNIIFEHFRGTTGIPGLKIYQVAVNLFADYIAAGRTQLFAQPNNVGSAPWVHNALGNPTAVPPGEQLLEVAINDIHWLYQPYAIKPASAQRFTQRFKVLPIGRDWVKLTTYDGILAGQAQRFLNVTTGAYGTTSGTFTEQFYTIYNLPNGAYQVESQYLTNATAGLFAALGLATADGVDTYVGDPAKGMIVYDEVLFQRPN